MPSPSTLFDMAFGYMCVFASLPCVKQEGNDGFEKENSLLVFGGVINKTLFARVGFARFCAQSTPASTGAQPSKGTRILLYIKQPPLAKSQEHGKRCF